MFDADTGVFTCSKCEAGAIETWPFVHCWRCGHREARPDLGLDENGVSVETSEPSYDDMLGGK